MDNKTRRIAFVLNEHSLRTLEQLKAGGFQFVEYGSLTIPVPSGAGVTEPSLTAGDVSSAPVPTPAARH